MRTVAVALLLGLILAVGYEQLADLTQTRSDPYVRGSRSEVVLRVQTRQPFRSEAESAGFLWGACHGTIGHNTVDPGLVAMGDGRFRVVLSPALGTHARQRLTGCLEDLTVDRVKARVASIRQLPADPGR